MVVRMHKYITHYRTSGKRDPPSPLGFPWDFFLRSALAVNPSMGFPMATDRFPRSIRVVARTVVAKQAGEAGRGRTLRKRQAFVPQ